VLWPGWPPHAATAEPGEQYERPLPDEVAAFLDDDARTAAALLF